MTRFDLSGVTVTMSRTSFSMPFGPFFQKWPHLFALADPGGGAGTLFCYKLNKTKQLKTKTKTQQKKKIQKTQKEKQNQETKNKNNNDDQLGIALHGEKGNKSFSAFVIEKSSVIIYTMKDKKVISRCDAVVRLMYKQLLLCE